MNNDNINKLIEAFEQAVQSNGAWNAIAVLPDALRSIALRHAEGSCAQQSFNRAANVLEGVTCAIDLPYQNGEPEDYSQSRRECDKSFDSFWRVLKAEA